MDGRYAELLYGSTVLAGRIPFVRLEIIMGIYPVVLIHGTVTNDLRHDRGACHEKTFPVAAHHGPRVRVILKSAVAIDEQDVGSDARVTIGALHGKDGRIEDIAKALCANGPEAIAQTKVLIEQVCHFDWERAVDITTKLIAERRISAEGQEGMQAFLEKRSPAWMQREQPEHTK
jgi:hypothetical protein